MEMTDINYNVYIDEAGDEGFKFDERFGHGSSDFFVLSAIIVEQSKDIELARIVNDIKSILNYQPKDILSPLHFCKMSHEKRKVCISKLKAFKDFTIISVVFQKRLLQEPLKVKYVLYNYACKLLLEKITIFLKRNNSKANFIFEHRRNTHYDDLKQYMKKVIDFKRYVLDLKPLPKPQSKCLQLADIIASATYQAFEPNQYDGDTEPLYLTKLKDNTYNHNGRILGYGLKIFPNVSELLEKEQYIWLNGMLRKH